MKSKYFTVEVKPTIAASKQALAAFTDGDLLFDWTSFQIPRGPAKLVKRRSRYACRVRSFNYSVCKDN